MPGHIVSSYDDELKAILRRISEMGGQAERMCTAFAPEP